MAKSENYDFIALKKNDKKDNEVYFVQRDGQMKIFDWVKNSNNPQNYTNQLMSNGFDKAYIYDKNNKNFFEFG